MTGVTDKPMKMDGWMKVGHYISLGIFLGYLFGDAHQDFYNAKYVPWLKKKSWETLL